MPATLTYRMFDVILLRVLLQHKAVGVPMWLIYSTSLEYIVYDLSFKKVDSMLCIAAWDGVVFPSFTYDIIIWTLISIFHVWLHINMDLHNCILIRCLLLGHPWTTMMSSYLTLHQKFSSSVVATLAYKKEPKLWRLFNILKRISMMATVNWQL